MRWRSVGLTSLIVAGSLWAHRAHACGGFFCNQPNGPTDLPVAQTGENVLFAMEPTGAGLYRLEAHIQIFYTGPADRFSWVVPVDALPVLEAGTNAVFTALETATRPRITINRRREGVCADDAVQPPLAGGSASDKSSRGGGFEDAGVQVQFRGNVGPYDATVVRADDPGRLKAWLAAEKYYLSDEGSRLIDDYVREQKYFVALKLLSGASVNEIQPIVLRFEARGPCVPLRLTAVASVKDLRVNLWVLARHRVVPENYFEIKINEAKLDWLGGGQNYQDLLKTAADEAGGNAFAVEYAGPTASLGGTLVPSGGYDLSRLATAPSFTLARFELEQVLRLGQDPTAMRILAKYAETFDATALAAEIDAQVVQPRVKAQKLFDAHPKLTRLVTFISPEEMKVDPTFIENTTLPDVSNVRVAEAILQCGTRAYTSCDAPMRLALPDGRSVLYRAPAEGWCASRSASGDRGQLDQMPSLERGWQRGSEGDGALRFDNSQKIAAALEAQRTEVLGGCSCAVGGRGSGAAALALLAGLAALIIARRRR